jgi:hypothetical protein
MRTSILVAGVSSAWIMSIIYYQIDVMTGFEFKPLLCLAIIAMALGLFLGCRKNKETTKGEA